MLGRGGTLVSIGLPKPRAVATIDLEGLFDRRLRILVSHGGDHLPAEDFPRLATLASGGEIDIGGLVTSTIGIDDVEGAFDDMRAGRGIRSVVLRF